MIEWNGGTTVHEFCTDYFSARERFCGLAKAAGCVVETHHIGVIVDSGIEEPQQLGIDVALRQSTQSERQVIVTSGVHGVEAPLGSAVQAEVLKRLCGYEPSCNIIMVHVLNPFGFYHGRRFDGDNIDLNRNFLRDDEAYEGSPEGYHQLNSLLNSTHASGMDCFKLKAAWQVYRNGMSQMQQAVASGQYDYPKGLFFGGAGPSLAHKWMREQLPCWVSGISHVTHFDFHTGLGRWARYMLMLDDEPRQNDLEWLRSLESASIKYPGSGTSAGYSARGSFGAWCKEVAEVDDYLFATAECGTYSPINVLAALRAENFWFHKVFGNTEDTSKGTGAKARVVEQYLAAKRRLQHVFIPRSERWRRKAVDQGAEFVLAALDRQLA